MANPGLPPVGGGGGGLGLEKGTNCGLTAAEQWLSQHEMAKKGGLSSYYIVRAVRVLAIFYIIITIVYIQICS